MHSFGAEIAAGNEHSVEGRVEGKTDYGNGLPLSGNGDYIGNR